MEGNYGSPELRANWFSQLFYCWLIPVFSKGNRVTLTMDDMFAVSKDKTCTALSRPLIKYWIDTVEQGKPNLWLAITKVVWIKFILLGIVYFLKECVLQVFISLLLGEFLKTYGQANPESSAFATAVYLLLASALYLIVTNKFIFYAMEVGYILGVALTTLVYKKTLRLNASSLSGTSSGELTNLLSSDIKRFETAVGNLHSLWTGPLLIIIVAIVLHQRYGWASISGLIALLLIALFGGGMGNLYSGYRRIAATKTGHRLKIIDEIISGIRFIKTYTWELLFEEKLKIAREAELAQIVKRMRLLAFHTNLGTISRRIIILVTLAFYIFTSDGLNSEKVFVTLAMYNTAASIMTGAFPSSVLMLSEMLVAVSRLKKYLLLAEDMDKSIVHHRGKPLAFKTNGRIHADNYCGNWISSGESAIRGLSFKIDNQHPLFVLGSVGSGKSSLLSSVLGSLETEAGYIETEGSISYAAQSPWVFTGTIKENILFGQPLIDAWYLTVIDACALLHDLKSFPFGDDTLVGDKGISLSGGQKARISLARAVYADADIYLMDDVLSAVDAEVGREIFKKVIQGLLKKKCLLMVTHQIQYVGNNHVLCINNGEIEDTGPRAEVEARNPQLFKTLEELGNEVDQEDSKTKEEELTESQEPVTMRSIRPEEVKSKSYGTFENSKSEENLSAPLMQSSGKEVQRSGVVGLGLCWTYIWNSNSAISIIYLIFMLIATQVLLSAVDFWLSVWTNNVEDQPNRKSYYYFGVYTILLVIDFIIGWMGNHNFFTVGIQSGRELHASASSALIRSRLEFFETNPTGRILNRFSKDMALVDEYLPITLFAAVSYGLQVIGIFVVSSILNPVLIAPSIVVMYVLVKIRRFYLRASSDIKRLEAIARSPVFSLLTTTLDGISTIKAFKQEALFQRRFESLKDSHSSVYFMFIASFTWLLQTLNWMALLYEAAVLIVFLGIVTDKAAAGLAIASVFTLGSLFSSGMQRSAELENDLVSVERLQEYANLESEAPLQLKSNSEPKWEPKNGSIFVQNLEVRYGNDIPVLHNITCVIGHGEKVGIVGRTGAGKSSLVSAMLRLLEPSAGRILIGGTDITTLGLHELRSKISIISQTPGFLQGTLRRNLDPFEKYSDLQLWDVLSSVQLASKVKDFPEGLLHEVAAGGLNFSQGERQLISLARALLTKNSILILDEATASVDFTTDEIIQREVRDKCSKCTVLTIAHRIETVLGSNRICVMHDGRIVEFDTPKRLLDDKSSRLSMLLDKSREQEKNT